MQDMNKGSFNSSGSGPTPKLGNKSTVKGLARPGQREAKDAAAEPVMAANGKLARPGFAQKKPESAPGRGTIARPGGYQDINKGVNTKPTKHMATTTDG